MKNKNGEKLYDFKLTANTLKIYVDKEYARVTIVEMIDEFGSVLKDAISGSGSKKEEKNRVEPELKRAQKDLERAKRDLERAKRKLKNS